MAEAASVSDRQHPLDGAVFAASGAAITAAPKVWRVSLRIDPSAAQPVEKALGLTLPSAPKTSSQATSRHSLWLGPDEWLIYDEKADPMADLAAINGAFSATDISHRNTAIIVSGPLAADVLNAGCPQDLSLDAFPVGACSRTVLGKAEVILYRVGRNKFRVEVWRSFSRYVFDFLAEAARCS